MHCMGIAFHATVFGPYPHKNKRKESNLVCEHGEPQNQVKDV